MDLISPQVPLSLVLSIGAIVMNAVSAVFRFLGKAALDSREQLAAMATAQSRKVADEALLGLNKAHERMHELEKSAALLRSEYDRTKTDVESILGAMVTREGLKSDLNAQTNALKLSISEAVRGSGRYPAAGRTDSPPPDVLPPPRPRLPSRPK